MEERFQLLHPFHPVITLNEVEVKQYDLLTMKETQY